MSVEINQAILALNRSLGLYSESGVNGVVNGEKANSIEILIMACLRLFK